MSSQKIRLRPICDDDSKLLFEWINNRYLVVFNAPYRPVSEAEHRAWFENIKRNTDVVFFMIEVIQSGITIGSCQLLNMHKIHRSAELQIRIGRAEFLGQGLGSEAVRLLVEYGFRRLGLHRIGLQVFSTNVRAILAYEKNGFVREGLLREAACIDENWVDVIVMGILNKDEAR